MSLRGFHADHEEVPLPAGHRFPMAKYRLLREALLAEGLLAEHELEASGQVPVSDLLRAHERGWVERVLGGAMTEPEVRRLGFPQSPALVRRSRASVFGTLAAARHALDDHARGVRPALAGNLAGGTHHAFHDGAAGYCLFNDLAVTARALLDTGRVRRVLVLDLDVHQGDGTARLFADDPRVFTCSLHGARNFPARKAASDLDVPLPDDTDDRAFLAALDRALPEALERGAPDLILYQAGVDALAADRLGRLSLSHAGLAARDARVFAAAAERHLPLAFCLGGGYAEPLAATVEAHLGTWRAARAAQRCAPRHPAPPTAAAAPAAPPPTEGPRP